MQTHICIQLMPVLPQGDERRKVVTAVSVWVLSINSSCSLTCLNPSLHSGKRQPGFPGWCHWPKWDVEYGEHPYILSFFTQLILHYLIPATKIAWSLAKVAQGFMAFYVLLVADVMLDRKDQVVLNTSYNSVKLSRLFCTEYQSDDLSVIEMKEDISACVNKTRWRHFE